MVNKRPPTTNIAISLADRFCSKKFFRRRIMVSERDCGNKRYSGWSVHWYPRPRSVAMGSSGFNFWRSRLTNTSTEREYTSASIPCTDRIISSREMTLPIFLQNNSSKMNSCPVRLTGCVPSEAVFAPRSTCNAPKSRWFFEIMGLESTRFMMRLIRATSSRGSKGLVGSRLRRFQDPPPDQLPRRGR